MPDGRRPARDVDPGAAAGPVREDHAALGNPLLVLLGEAPPSTLHDAVAARAGGPLRVRVVAPALVRVVDWLATAEDEAQRRAEVRAFAAEWSLADAAEVSGGAGDADPVQAVDDALHEFDADEILLAGDAADPDLEEALARFGLPVSRVGPAAARRRSRPYRTLRGLVGGRSPATPFVLFVGVNALLLVASLLLSLLVTLVLWLTGSL